MEVAQRLWNVARGDLSAYPHGSDEHVLTDLVYMYDGMVRGIYRGVRTALRHPIIYPRVLTVADHDLADLVAGTVTPLIEQAALRVLGYDDPTMVLLVRWYQMFDTDENATELRIPLR